MNVLGALFPLQQISEKSDNSIDLHEFLPRLFPFAHLSLLRGDADQCFRSLLFQVSVSYASIGKRVKFYTPTPLTTIPPLVHNFIPSPVATAHLDLIEFHYLPSLRDVLKHLVDSSADIFIIDGYLEFPVSTEHDRYQIHAACALLRDTYDYVKQKIENPNLVLVCSCTCADPSIANVEQQGLFDLGVNIEMMENGDYSLKTHSPLKPTTSFSIHFRMGSNEIIPLTTFINLFDTVAVIV